MTKNIIIVGQSSSGKTTFLRTCFSGTYIEVQHANYGADFYVTNFNSNIGEQQFGILDVSAALYTLNYVSMHGAIIMVDKSKEDFMKWVKHYTEEINKHWKDIPIIVCGSKNDLNASEIKDFSSWINSLPISEKYPTMNSRQVTYLDVSSLNMENITKPFLLFSRHFNNNPNITFLLHKL